jgi:DNA-binding transcriptional MerR regulator
LKDKLARRGNFDAIRRARPLILDDELLPEIFPLTMTPLVSRISVMKNEAKKFSIDEICALVEMNKRTVRYYIQKGLVDRPEGVGKGAFYRHAHLEQLLAIRKWKTAGLSLERIQDILAGEKEGGDDRPVPPPLPQRPGMVEVWSHMHIANGIELHIHPGRAGLSPEQVRTLFKEMINLAQRIREEES